VEKCVI
jgi:hypothetical protein